jgi:hypothetical protein
MPGLMMYLGIETGNDILLKKITKGATSKGIFQACQKAKAHKFVLSCMVILGIGGSKYTKQHIDDTANLVSIVSPDFLAALNLQLEAGIYEEFMRKFGERYIPLSDYEVLDELERLVSHINSELRSISGKPCFQCILSRWNTAHRQEQAAFRYQRT